MKAMQVCWLDLKSKRVWKSHAYTRVFAVSLASRKIEKEGVIVLKSENGKEYNIVYIKKSL